MTYYMIRFGIGIFFLIYTLLNMRIRKMINRKKIWQSILVTALLTFVLTQLPVEKYLITFDSPEAAFKYFSTKEIAAVIQGKDSCAVVYEDSSKNKLYHIKFLKKVDNGYKAISDRFVEFDSYTLPNARRYTGTLYHVKNTYDYYIRLTKKRAQKKFNISDTENSKFIELKGSSIGTTYYTWLDDIHNDYMIIADGYEFQFPLKLLERLKIIIPETNEGWK